MTLNGDRRKPVDRYKREIPIARGQAGAAGFVEAPVQIRALQIGCPLLKALAFA